MGKSIQLVKISDKTTLFICGFDEETEEMSFRTNHSPSYLQKEKIKMDGRLVYTNMYHFPTFFLTRFITNNM